MTAKTIAYQGEPGANSHIACLDDYPDHQPLACATLDLEQAAISRLLRADSELQKSKKKNKKKRKREGEESDEELMMDLDEESMDGQLFA